MNPPERPGLPPNGGETAIPSRPAILEPTSLFLFGVPFHDVTEDETLQWVVDRARAGKPCHVVTSNLDFMLQAWRDPEMHRIHLEADLVLADGWPPVLFSRFFGPPLRARVAGSDIVPRLGEAARDHDLSIFALGGAPGVGEKAMGILKERFPGLRVAGCASPPKATLLEMDHEGLRESLAAARPDVLFVAFGAPKQEKWIRMNAQRARVPVSIGVGGSLDFIAGAQTRAPRFFQKVGLEWLWRLALQPRRLFGRYSSNILFLILMLGRLSLARLLPAGHSGRWVPSPSELAQVPNAVLLRFPLMAGASEASVFSQEVEGILGSRPVVLDLTGRSWLNSLELGVLARLARTARRGGRVLVLAGVAGRVARLIRILRLNRDLDLPSTADAWLRRQKELEAPPEERAARWTPDQGGVTLLLPEQFEREEADRVGQELDRRCGDGVLALRVDGRRLNYIDSSGLRFLRQAWSFMGKRPGGSIRLLSFPESALRTLKREGLDFLPAEGTRPG
jgi:N-acetylglucosaminyldiphosphoundecaprenol N-acetyl-beta-D-mannosaminyltransferase